MSQVQQAIASDSIRICVLDNDPSMLRKTSEILLSAGWHAEPFVDPDTILNYAATHQPAAAIVNLNGPRANGLDIAARLRAISPSTSVIISLKVHASRAHKMLKGTELVNLIKRRCVQASKRPLCERPTFSQSKEIDLGCCA